MILEGISAVLLDPSCIIWVFIGTVVGIIFGCIPGLTATMAIAMFLPVTYNMASTQGISVLTALYIGGISGGLISAILLNIPGLHRYLSGWPADGFEGRGREGAWSRHCIFFLGNHHQSAGPYLDFSSAG